MAARRKKARGASAARKVPSARPRWITFVLGAISGVVVTLVIQQVDDFSPWSKAPPPAKTRADSKVAVNGKIRTPPEKPRFQFYTLLPEMEVAVPEEELQARAATPRPPTKPEQTAPATIKKPAAKVRSTPEKASVKGQFVLQVGSFSKAGDAERLKANLALLGLSAHIQTVQINGSDTWHRVRAGPFGDLQSVNGARGRIRANDMDGIVLKVRR